MAEQQLPIETSGKYKNIQLKPRKGVGGLAPGNSVVLEKLFETGTPVPSKIYANKDGSPQISYAVKAIYKDEEVSFWLNEREHDLWATMGDKGTRVQVTLVEESFLNPKSGIKMLVPRLQFEMV